MRPILSLYSFRLPDNLVYMLQSSEYRADPYLKWFWRTKDFNLIQHRRHLDKTTYARALSFFLKVGMSLEIIGALVLIILGSMHHVPGAWAFGWAILLAYPIVWAHLVVVPLELGRLLIAEPKAKAKIARSRDIFNQHSAVKIAVAGSYGKTSMKEVLHTVLSEGKKVAATKANLNVGVAHANFAHQLKGDEEVLIIEYGEGAPGDVARFSFNTKPTHAVITGLAPAHLDKYKTLKAAGEDIFSLAKFLKDQNVYVNKDSLATKDFIKPKFVLYSEAGAGGWSVSDVLVNISGLSFKLKKDAHVINLKSSLIGRHQVGVLSLAAVLAIDLGLSIKDIESGIAKTKPFSHRMQPYELSGAWVIDDTYNGNIDGIKAGTALLSELDFKRKIYVTPGLVEQGPEVQAVHEQMGQLIATARPEIVILMSNSTTEHIKSGLTKAGFKGELRIELDPLNFYMNLEHFVAKGDLVLMQNDWPDNYS